ncbi:PA2169 family four-helix-bundle protein [Chitinophaga sp.]|uniref:PA2169 family four-helix-bundle protein n=1 Tax=Chitinophaga sp. TaxID=1869181 RepID=UPI0031D14419
MQATLETIEILNDLIQINNDRIDGYEKALEDLRQEDNDLRALFSSMISESHEIRLALGTEVNALGGDMETSTTTSGKIYRAWMDIKAVFTGNDRHSVLANCERGEDAAQKAYNTALEDEDMPAYLRDMIVEQQQTLKRSHDKIKALRDA